MHLTFTCSEACSALKVGRQLRTLSIDLSWQIDVILTQRPFVKGGIPCAVPYMILGVRSGRKACTYPVGLSGDVGRMRGI